MRFEFHPEALAEYEAAARHYHQQRPGLELRFIESVESAIVGILEHPEAARRFDGEIRRRLTHIFPYAVLYAVEPERILVIAVTHSRRRPGYWHKRVHEPTR